MQVILDANIIKDNWYLKSPNFLVLEKLVQFGKCRLVIPEIVILEVRNLFRKELTSLTTSINKVNQIIPEVSKGISFPNIEELCGEYNKAFYERLKEFNAEVLGHDDIPHAAIVARSLASRKPFTQSDKGYRDTLIWEVILRKAANPKITTFFISGNWRDFGQAEGSNQLHNDLLEDLESKELPSDSVQIYPSLKQWVDEQGKPCLEQFAVEVIEPLTEGKYKSFSLQEWFTENRDQLIETLNEQIESILQMWHELENPYVSYLENPEKISVNDVYGIDENLIYLDVEILTDTTVDVFVYKWDYDWVGDKYPIETMDHDWNESYVWAQLVFTIPLKFAIIFNIRKEQVEEYELSDIEIFGWCRYCGATVLSDAAEKCYECGKSFG